MKQYVKPELFYENFELSHSIAACSESGDYAANSHDKNHCHYMIGDQLLFTSNQTCNLIEGSDVANAIMEIYCYQTGSDNYTMFNS